MENIYCVIFKVYQYIDIQKGKGPKISDLLTLMRPRMNRIIIKGLGARSIERAVPFDSPQDAPHNSNV